MLLPPSINLFRDDCVNELDLQRFREFLFATTPTTARNGTVGKGDAPTNVLMEVVAQDGNEQDLLPFDSTLLKPLQSLPPGKLPGINFDAETDAKLPTSIFSFDRTANLNSSAGNSPKRRKLDQQQQQQQNFTIQHF